jgi:hypothetical protein
MQALRVDSLRESAQKYEEGKGVMHRRLRIEALDWFKGEVRSGTMAKEDAEGIFNGLADSLGWDTVESITTLFTVTVDYDGETIAEFSDIEADDEDSACEEVEGNINIDDVEVTLQVSYNGSSQEGTVNRTYEFDPSDLSFTATEQ